MEISIIEIKARCTNHDRIRQLLKSLGATFKGKDHQFDIYFKIPNGRLKLRQGNIEQALIYYRRENIQEPKSSKVILFKHTEDSSLKEILTRALGVRVIVDKLREIYFIDNVKFHLDQVKYLGSFVEIEAIDRDGTIGKEQLEKQCKYYLQKFDIQDSELIAGSYSDLLAQLLSDMLHKSL